MHAVSTKVLPSDYRSGDSLKPLALLFALIAVVAACGSSGGGSSGGVCKTNADCGTQHACAFLQSDGCMAAGQCVAAGGPVCNAFMPGCACDGTVINTICTGLPQGYVSKPFLHAGTC